MIINVQQHDIERIMNSTYAVHRHFETINEHIQESTVESLTDAVECADDAQRILESLIHKLQANRAELRYAIDELKRNTIKVG
jgi:hypothetical protein